MSDSISQEEQLEILELEKATKNSWSGQFNFVRSVYFAAEKGHVNVLKYLVSQAPNGVKVLEAPNICGTKAVTVAAWNGHVNVLEYLVANAPSGSAMLEAPNNYGETLAYIAARKGYVKVLEFLISHAPSGAAVLEIKTNYGELPVTIAFRSGHRSTVRFIVKNAPGHCGLLTGTMNKWFKNQIGHIDQLKQEIIENYLKKEYHLLLDFLEFLSNKESLVFDIINVMLQQTQLLLDKQ